MKVTTKHTKDTKLFLIHHGGELVVMLGMQGLSNFELGDLGGHIIEPPLAD